MPVRSRTRAKTSSFEESITSSAPSSLARAAFAGVDVVARTRPAPSSRATWIDAVETPDPAACTRIVSPGRSAARSASMCHAVRVTRGNAAPASKETDAGRASAFRSGTTTCVAQVPSRVSPRIPYHRQRWSFPDAHAWQAPHDRPGARHTRSPAFLEATPGPTASTTPAPSQPGTSGRG